MNGEECQKCQKLLKPEQVVWVEMCTCWKPFGMCGNRSPEHSQGSHSFGRDCAKKMGVKKFVRVPVDGVADGDFDWVGEW